MLSPTTISAFLASLAMLPSTFGLPASEAQAAHVLIPGPGLPSLESLGWNMTYINSLPDPVLSHTTGTIDKRAEGRCGGSYGNVNDAIVCYKFLNALGTYQCTVPGGQRSAVLAYSGAVRVEGFGIGASSYCRDVAVGVLWSIDRCTRPQQDTAGTAPAYGNGNYLIYVGN